MKKRILVLILALAILVSLGACAPADQGGASGLAGTSLTRIKEKGTIVIGCDPTIENIIYDDPNAGQISGFIPDMINDWAATLEIKVEWVTLEWSAMITALNTGKVDMVAANMNRTVVRASNITFTDPWLIDSAMACVDINSSWQSFDDLQAPGTKFGVASGSIYETIVPELFPQAEVVVLPLGTWQDSLTSGIIDASLDDSIVFAGPLSRNPNLRILPDKGPSYRYAFAVAQGDHALAECFNVYLSELKFKGDYAKLYRQWMGFDWTPSLEGAGV